MANQLPALTATMLGPTSSGKTVFTLGMYAYMSRGIAGHFLHATDNDTDVRIRRQWRHLLMEGTLPPPTAEVDQIEYSFTLKDGMEPLLAVDWLDYRGGAIDSEASTQDVTNLRDRLRESDAVYLMLDGNQLRGGLDDENLYVVEAETRAGYMTNMLNVAFDDERPWPALVVAITKSDLLGGDNPGRDDHEIETELIAAVRRLLPACFQKGVTTMVCPVSVGDFGPAGGAKPGAVRLVNTHKPLLFSLAQLLLARVDQSVDMIASARYSRAAGSAELDRISGSFFGRFRPGKRRELGRRIDRFDAELATHVDLNEQDRERIRVIGKELSDVHVFVDGEPAVWSVA